MHIIDTELPDVKILTPDIFQDSRGFFFESFNSKTFKNLVGYSDVFVQDNHSNSKMNVLRGLHYQLNDPQAKLVSVLNGEIFDVAVDLRKDSKTFGQWAGKILSSENKHQMWVPVGFAHGFYVTSKHADVLYKTSDFYNPKDERCILWNDDFLSIEWPISNNIQPILSPKDLEGVSFHNADHF
jgi:dTDP-4-dehydrorhamnose 3,5-epimerase